MEHTKGPWNIQRNVTNYRSGRKSLEIRGASDELIASFPGCERDSANARLIAAAPELLSELKAHQQALTMLMDAVEIDAESTYFSFKSDNGLQIAKITFAELQSRAHDAIAKSTNA